MCIAIALCNFFSFHYEGACGLLTSNMWEFMSCTTKGHGHKLRDLKKDRKMICKRCASGLAQL